MIFNSYYNTIYNFYKENKYVTIKVLLVNIHHSLTFYVVRLTWIQRGIVEYLLILPKIY